MLWNYRAVVQSDRLLATLLLLQSRGPMPAPELARRLEVSVRTVYRDVTALSAAGVPVWAERGRAGGIRLLDGWHTDVTGFTAAEAEALFAFSARPGALPGGDGALGSAFRKLLAALPDEQRRAAAVVEERILVEPQGWRRAPDAAPALPVLHRAALDGQRLALTYRAVGRQRARTRAVDPVGLVVKAGVWYLVADQDGEARLFRASRVLRAVATGASVPSPRPALAETWQRVRDRVDQPVSVVVARVRVPHALLGRVLGVCGPQLAGDAERRHGSIWSTDSGPSEGGDGPTGAGDEPADEELRLPFRSLAQAAGVLLGLAADIDVLSPPELRLAIAERAAATATRYGV